MNPYKALEIVIQLAEDRILQKYDYICDHEEDCSCNQETLEKQAIYVIKNNKPYWKNKIDNKNVT